MEDKGGNGSTNRANDSARIKKASMTQPVRQISMSPVRSHQKKTAVLFSWGLREIRLMVQPRMGSTNPGECKAADFLLVEHYPARRVEYLRDEASLHIRP